MFPRKTGILHKLLIVLIVCCALGIIRISILETRCQDIAFDVKNVVIDEGRHEQSNCVLLVETGGLKTFPFIWSEVLYLYDVENAKKYFVDIAKIPYESYRNCFIVGYDVYFEKAVITETPNLKHKNLITGNTQQLNISSKSYIATEDALLYWASEKELNFLNRYKDGETEVLVPESVEDIACSGTEVYWFKEDTSPYDVYEYDLDNMTSTRLNFSMQNLGWIYKMNISEYLFVDEFTLYKWDDKTKRKQRLSKSGDVSDSVFYKDGFVYYKREDQTIVKLDPINGNARTCIDIKQYGVLKENAEYATYIDTVDYCEDYIAVFISEEKGSKSLSSLLFFEYNGNYIRRF